MRYIVRPTVVCLFAILIFAPGCATSNGTSDHTAEGGIFGGLLGAGTGAIIGHAAGNTAAGAAIGAGAGALTGAAIGAGQDKVENENRAAVQQQVNAQMAQAVRVEDVINMTRAGVDPNLIANQVRAHGVAAPLQSSDVILLQQQGVAPQVIAAMQSTPVPCVAGAVVVPGGPPPVVVEGYYGRPYWHHPHPYWW